MSRRKNRKQRGIDRADGSDSAVEVFPGDGYVSRPALLKAASELFSAGTFVKSGLTQNTELLTTMYREKRLAKKILCLGYCLRGGMGCIWTRR